MRSIWNGMGAFCVLLIAACSSDSDGAGTPEDVSIAGEGLSNHESCDMAAPDVFFDLDPDDFTSARPSETATSGTRYGSSACAAAYVVDVRMGTFAPVYFRTKWAGEVPGTADACTGARVMAYAWLIPMDDEGVTTYLGNASAYGSWVPLPSSSDPNSGICFVPTLLQRSWMTGPQGTYYQIAVSARRRDNSVVPVTVSVN